MRCTYVQQHITVGPSPDSGLTVLQIPEHLIDEAHAALQPAEHARNTAGYAGPHQGGNHQYKRSK